jgi:hypothetical protein
VVFLELRMVLVELLVNMLSKKIGLVITQAPGWQDPRGLRTVLKVEGLGQGEC